MANLLKVICICNENFQPLLLGIVHKWRYEFSWAHPIPWGVTSSAEHLIHLNDYAMHLLQSSCLSPMALIWKTIIENINNPLEKKNRKLFYFHNYCYYSYDYPWPFPISCDSASHKHFFFTAHFKIIKGNDKKLKLSIFFLVFFFQSNNILGL